MNRLKPDKEEKVLTALSRPGYCLRAIVRNTGVSMNTVRKIEEKVVLHPDNENFKLTHLT